MSLLTACGWTALRALIVALIAMPLCVTLVRLLHAPETRRYKKARLLIWASLLIPFLTPDLLVGYAYGNFSPLPLVHHPWLGELLYGVLLWMKLVPVGVVVLLVSPPAPLSAEAIHCRRLSLAPQASPLKRWTAFVSDVIRGPARRLFPAFGLMYLLAFQEFELGALLGITAGRVGSPVSWTRTLFENQQGVIDRLAPLKWSLWPLLFDLAVLIPLVGVTVRNRQFFGASSTTPKPVGRAARSSAYCYIALAFLAITIVPLVCVVRESSAAFSSLLASQEQFVGLLREVLIGSAFAVISGLLAYLLAGIPLGRRMRTQQFGFKSSRSDSTTWEGEAPAEPQLVSDAEDAAGGWGRPTGAPSVDIIPQLHSEIAAQRELRPPNMSGWRILGNALRTSAAIPLIPGLAGSLIVGLSVLYLFQTDWLYRLYDTPLPLGIALVLFLAPRALLLQLLFRAGQSGESVELAKMLAASPSPRPRRAAGQLLWSLKRSRAFWSVALLALWAYWDLTSAAMLHPSSMVPASIRLYNLMHYGHNAVLSAMTLIAVAIPLLLAWMAASILRPLSGRLV